MRHSKLVLLGFIACLVIGMLVLCTGNTQAQVSNSVWGFVANVVPTSANLYGVYMQDVNTAWLAGRDRTPGEPTGRVYKIAWHDGQWVLVSTYSFRAPLRAIVAISDDNVWAVGDERLIVHKDASGWQEVGDLTGLPENSNFTTLQMFSNGEEGWAAGNTETKTETQFDVRAFTVHLADGRVHKVTLAGTDPSVINSLHFADGDGWAVGSGFIWHFSADKSGSLDWRVEANVPPCYYGYVCGDYLLAVRVISSEEVWAVGYEEYVGIMPSPRTGVIFHRINGQWQRVAASFPGWGNWLNSLSFSNDGLGLAVGGYVTDLGGTEYPVIMSYRADAKWHNEIVPRVPNSGLNAISQYDSAHALAVGDPGLILSYGYGPGSPPPTPMPTLTPVPLLTGLPSEPVSDPQNPLITYFPLVGHTLWGGFRDYWNAHGGLGQFGYPITEQFQEANPTDGKMYTVQYFERARFEWHPENKPPFDVLLGLLGRTITQGREKETPFLPAQPQKSPGFVYFPSTGHNMAPQFVQYWQNHGGLPVYGYPISEAFMEVSKADGKPYLVQYFERNRFEYHPELPGAYRVSLGLLGTEVLRARGWIQ
jgi:hypothetical protein